MVKRKASNGVNTQKSKKVKKVSESNNNDENMYGKINCSKPISTLNSLLGTDNAKDFFNSHWEKKYLHVKRNNKQYYGDIFSMQAMEEMIDGGDLQFESDINVCRYVDGEKELLNDKGCEYADKGDDDEMTITKTAFKKLMKDDKATFQFHQPQRFSDPLWNVMEKLETHFGSLFGCNVYLTPASAQGLAPHCDDVEIFVLQIEGKKTWKLYKPMVELSRDYTQDLEEEDIGEPMFEVTLEPGDLLYFPRGTIHQAKTTDEGHSLHLSISTYQMNTWGDIMNHAVSQAIENALEDDVEIRSGLPVNFLSFLGSAHDLGNYVELEDKEKNKDMKSNEKDSRVVEFKNKIKAHLSKLIDHIDVNTAADAMSSDFMCNRLPPFGHELKEDDDADKRVPKVEDKIRLKHHDHIRIVYSNGDEDDKDLDASQWDDEDDDSEMEEDEKPAEKKPSKKTPKKDEKKKSAKSDTENEDDDEDDDDASPGDEEPCIKLMHSFDNPREGHMIGKILQDVTSQTFPVHYGPALIALLNTDKFVQVKDISLDDDDDKLQLATSLYADDLIEFES